jgi:hypothetical protein
MPSKQALQDALQVQVEPKNWCILFSQMYALFWLYVFGIILML